MPVPWFYIRCPSCWGYWEEHGRLPPADRRTETLLLDCPHCGELITIEWERTEAGVTILFVLNYGTQEYGDFLLREGKERAN